MKSRLILLIIILANFGFRMWAIDRGSLWEIQPDEWPRVVYAIYVASTGNLNHGYFNHPSSTVIYPLAGIYHLWGIIAYKGEFLQANPALDEAIKHDSGELYLLGRYLVVAFTTAGVPLVYLLGQRAFNKRVGLIGAALWIIIPGIAYYTQIVRDDMPALFFGLLSLWLCLKLIDEPSARLHGLAGLAIGLATATRYFMGILGLVLVTVDAILLWRYRNLPQQRRQLLLKSALGIACIALAFLISTPYFLVDFSEVKADLALESRTEHLSADGLSPPENFLWYLTYAIPASVTWLLAILAVIGIAFALFERTTKQVVLFSFSLFFLIFISLQALHWERWTIPILPIIILFAAKALDILISKLSIRLTPTYQRVALILAFFLLAVGPTIHLVQQLVRQSEPSTRILAREWAVQNLPSKSKIIQEAGTAYLNDTPFQVYGTRSLPTTDYTIEQVYSEGYKYVIVNMEMYQRFAAEKDKYPYQLSLYQALFDKGILLQEIKSSLKQEGPTIRIYELPQEPN